MRNLRLFDRIKRILGNRGELVALSNNIDGKINEMNKKLEQIDKKHNKKKIKIMEQAEITLEYSKLDEYEQIDKQKEGDPDDILEKI